MSFQDDLKADAFEPHHHRENKTPLIVTAPDGTITREANPIFCQPFTLGDEIAAWVSGGPRSMP